MNRHSGSLIHLFSQKTRERLRYLRPHSIFTRLIVSYTLIILTVVVLIGTVSYASFSSGFRQEVTNVHQHMRSFVIDVLEQYFFEKANALYLDLVLKQDAPGNSDHLSLLSSLPQDRSVRILNAFRHLQQVAGYESDTVESIDLYYENNQIVVSSSAGVKYLANPAKTWYDGSWIEEYRRAPVEQFWKRVVRGSPATISLVMMAPLPQVYVDERTVGIIAISLKESKLYDYLKRFSSDEKEETFIIDGNGDLVSRTSRDLLFVPVKGEPYVRAIMESTKSSGEFVTEIGGAKSLVFFSTLPGTGWKLVSTIRVNDFYRHAIVVRNTILATCMLVVLGGLALAYHLSSRIYNPLKAITERLQRMFGALAPRHGTVRDEYHVIDDAIDAMSKELGQLQNSIQANKSIIKANLIRGLFSHAIRTEPEYQNRLRLLDMRLKHERLTPLILKFETTLSQDAVAVGTIEEIIRFIEGMGDAETRFLACEEGNEMILVLAGTSREGAERIPQYLDAISAHIAANWVLPVFLCVGEPAENPLDVHLGYLQAQAALNYRYFKPTLKVLVGREFQDRDRCAGSMPRSWLQRMESALAGGDAGAMITCLEGLVHDTESGGFAATDCHQQLLSFVSLVCEHIRSHGILHHRIGDDPGKRFAEIRDIHEYQSCMTQLLEEIAFHASQGRKNKDIVELVKTYVAENLGYDLSLTSVASKIAISPNYLSRMFKDETGEHFVEFVIENRMRKARELLETTALSIEHVSHSVGYNTTTYFIKRFRERYGMTPKHFRSFTRISS